MLVLRNSKNFGICCADWWQYGFRQKQDDDLKQMAGALRIVAVSPHKDNNYMLMFCRAGATEQLTYRMEGISNGCGQSADICIECKRFLALAKLLQVTSGLFLLKRAADRCREQSI